MKDRLVSRLAMGMAVLCALAAPLRSAEESESVAPALKLHFAGARGETLFRHQNLVTSVVPLDDGKRALTSSFDGEARLWDLEQGKVLRRFGDDRTSVWCVALAAGGKTVLTATDDSKVRAWDFETGKCLREYTGTEKSLRFCVGSPDGSQILGYDVDGTFLVWAAGTSEPLRRFSTKCDWGYPLAVTVDGRIAASGGSEGELLLWDVQKGAQLRELKRQESGVSVVCFDPKGERLVSASDDGKVCCWRVSDGKCLWSCEAKEESTDLAWSHDGNEIAMVEMGELESESVVVLLDAATGAERRRYALGGEPWQVAYAPGDKRLLACLGHTLCGFDAATGKRLIPPPSDRSHLESIEAIWPLPSGEVLTADTTRVLRWKDGAPAEPVTEHEEIPYNLALSPDGKSGISLDGSSDLRIFDMTTMQVKEALIFAEGFDVQAARWKPEGLRVLRAVHVDKDPDRLLQFEVWDGQPLRKTTTLEGQTDYIMDAVLSVDGACVAAILSEFRMCVWDAASGRMVQKVELGSEDDCTTYGLCYLDPSGVLLASVNNRLRAWRRPKVSTARIEPAEVSRLEKMLESEEYQERVDAVQALAALGPGALPHLTPPEKASAIEVRARLKQVREQIGFSRLPVMPVCAGKADQAQVLELEGVIDGLAAHPAGRYFTALTEKEGRFALWWCEVSEGGMRVLQQIETPGTEPCMAVAFSPDGKFLYVATDDTRYCVYELK